MSIANKLLNIYEKIGGDPKRLPNEIKQAIAGLEFYLAGNGEKPRSSYKPWQRIGAGALTAAVLAAFAYTSRPTIVRAEEKPTEQEQLAPSLENLEKGPIYTYGRSDQEKNEIIKREKEKVKYGGAKNLPISSQYGNPEEKLKLPDNLNLGLTGSNLDGNFYLKGHAETLLTILEKDRSLLGLQPGISLSAIDEGRWDIGADAGNVYRLLTESGRLDVGWALQYLHRTGYKNSVDFLALQLGADYKSGSNDFSGRGIIPLSNRKKVKEIKGTPKTSALIEQVNSDFEQVTTEVTPITTQYQEVAPTIIGEWVHWFNDKLGIQAAGRYRFGVGPLSSEAKGFFGPLFRGDTFSVQVNVGLGQGKPAYFFSFNYHFDLFGSYKNPSKKGEVMTHSPMQFKGLEEAIRLFAKDTEAVKTPREKLEKPTVSIDEIDVGSLTARVTVNLPSGMTLDRLVCKVGNTGRKFTSTDPSKCRVPLPIEPGDYVFFIDAIAKKSGVTGEVVGSAHKGFTVPEPAPTPSPTPSALEVSCSGSPNPALKNQLVTWTATVSGGTEPYTHNWSGTDGLSGATSPITKSYSTIGIKEATDTVTSADSQTKSANCNITVVGVGGG